jgi:hypothetical protein
MFASPGKPSDSQSEIFYPMLISVWAVGSIWFELAFGNCFKATFYPDLLSLASQTTAQPPLPSSCIFEYPLGHLSPYKLFSDSNSTTGAFSVFLGCADIRAVELVP